MENNTEQPLISTKQKATIGVLIAVIIALVGSLFYINQSQDVRDRANEPESIVSLSNDATADMCPIDGAMCSWKSIPGATYCYSIFKKVNGQWQQVKPAAGGCTRTTENSVPFTAEKNGEYRCDVKVVEMPSVNGKVCPTPGAGSATQICNGIPSTPTPIGGGGPGTGTPSATATSIPTSTASPTNVPTNKPVATATPGSNSSGNVATATPKQTSEGGGSKGGNPDLPKAGFLEFSLAFAALGLLVVLFGFSL